MKLRNQMVWSCVTIVAAALVLSFVVFSVSWINAARQSMRESLEITARIAGNESTASIQFDEPLSAREIVKQLGQNPNLREATVLTPEGALFASFQREPARQSTALAIAIGESEFSGNTLEVREPIVIDGQLIGSIYVNSILTPMYRELFRSVLMTAAIIGFCLGVAIWMLIKVLGSQLSPIERLSQVALVVAEDHDYSRRVATRAANEVGELADAFNHMLATIEKQQDRLVKAKRMESLGLLAGGVAHDLNNILGPVVGYPGLILSTMDARDPNVAYIKAIEECATKAGSVLQGLLSFARRGNHSTEPLAINRVLEELVASPGLQTRLASHPNTQLIPSFELGLPLIQGAESQLTQAILNLAINAIEAMGDSGGILRIASRVVAPEQPLFEAVDDQNPFARHIEISVSDEGCGIPREKLAEIFEPFSSSKPMAESGTGMGLAVVAGVIQDHKGHIDVASEVGQGTVFRILLPVDEYAVLRPRDQGEVRGNAENILVVDDYAPQREVLMQLLGNLGYRAAAAESGSQAVCEFPAGNYDMVVLDMKMEEGFDGLDTYRALRAIDRDVACLIVTGDADSERVKEAIHLGAYECVAKPFSIEHLSQRVHEALQAKRAA